MQFRAHASLIENLRGIPRTLLVPLAARAQGAATFPMLDPQDQYARDLMTSVGAEAQTSVNDAPTVVSVLWRTGLIKNLGHEFFTRHPKSLGVNLGAGLAHYFQWLGNGHNHWMDVDLQQVIDLRRAVIPDGNPRCDSQAMDITEPGWWSRLSLDEQHHNHPVFVICEGVLMYLLPSKVKQIIQEIGDNAPEGSELVLDFLSPLAIGPTALHIHHEEPDAPFNWGVHNGLEIAHLHPRLELLSQHSVSEAYGLAASWAEMCWSPILGGPVYGMAHLRVSEP